MEKLFVTRSGKLFEVSVIKDTGKQLLLEENDASIVRVRKCDLGKVQGQGIYAYVSGETKEEVIKAWENHVDETINTLQRTLDRLKSVRTLKECE